LEVLNADEIAIQEAKDAADEQRRLKQEDEARIAAEVKQQREEVQAIDQEWRTQGIEDQKQYVADAQRTLMP
jgi:hypothetical protein